MSKKTVSLESLKPHDRNPRRILDKAFEKLCNSIKRDPEFMPLRPICFVDGGTIIAGTQRYRACLHLGMTAVPADWVRDVSHLGPDARRRLQVVDNVSAGEFDWDILSADWDLPELEELGLDVPEMAGHHEGDSDAEPQVNRAEELNEKWKVKAGDLWLIGEHRLLCGDSTNTEDVARVLGDAKPVLMVTDPPYEVNYYPAWRVEAGLSKNSGKMGIVTNDDRADWSEAWKLFCGDVAYVYHAGVMSSTVQASLETCGFKIRAQIIWAKDRMALSRGDYHWQHEPCWYAVRDGKPGHRTDDRKQTTLWEIPARDDSGHGHGTQKPVECMARPMRNHHATEVYDPFLGSGTTMVAAQNLGRKCYGIEISPAYFAVILERMITAFPEIDIRRNRGKKMKA